MDSAIQYTSQCCAVYLLPPFQIKTCFTILINLYIIINICVLYIERDSLSFYMNIDIKSKAKTTTILQQKEYYIRFPPLSVACHGRYSSLTLKKKKTAAFLALAIQPNLPNLICYAQTSWMAGPVAFSGLAHNHHKQGERQQAIWQSQKRAPRDCSCAPFPCIAVLLSCRAERRSK